MFDLGMGIGVAVQKTIQAAIAALKTGLLSLLTPNTISVIGTNVYPFSILIDPADKHVYFFDNVGISHYTRDLITGLLTASEFLTVATSKVGGISPDGKFLYASTTNTILIYSINSTTGVLTLSSTHTKSTAYSTSSNHQFTSDGLFMYCENGSSGGFNGYNVNTTTGALTLIGFYSFPTLYRLTMSPDGKNVYGASSSNISQKTRNLSTGVLTDMVPATIAGGTTITHIVFRDDSNMYTIDQTANLIRHYSRDPATGILTFVNNISIPANSEQLRISKDGLTLYIMNTSANKSIGQIKINTDGSLSALTPASISLPNYATDILPTNDNNNVYVGNIDPAFTAPGVIYQFKRD